MIKRRSASQKHTSVNPGTIQSKCEVVLEGDLAQGMVLGLEELLFPIIAAAAGLFGRGAVMGQLVGVDAVEQFGEAPDEEDALAQEGAQGAFGGRIDVGGRNEVGAQEVGEFFGVDAIVLVLAAVNEVEVKSVGQDEGQTLGLAA